MGNLLYAYHSLLEAPLDLEALGLRLHSLFVNLALITGVLGKIHNIFHQHTLAVKVDKYKDFFEKSKKIGFLWFK